MSQAHFVAKSLQHTLWKYSIEGILLIELNELKIRYANPAVSTLMGYQNAELIKQSLSHFAINLDAKKSYPEILQQIQTTGFWEGDLWLRHRSGSICHYLTRWVRYRESDGTEQGLILLNQKQAHTELLIDPLTQLPTRHLLSYFLQKTYTFAQRHGRRFGLLMIGVGKMKEFNRDYGYELGDEFLKALGEIIRTTVRDSDSVARYEGDVFCVSLDELAQLRDAALVANMLLFKLTQKMMLLHHNRNITVQPLIYMGMAVYPEDALSLAALFELSESAMKRAIDAGDSRCEFCHAWLRNQFGVN
jgi:diguanylate cyclase (GGDEF)-like protein/PAS domain S-box-containing protein